MNGHTTAAVAGTHRRRLRGRIARRVLVAAAWMLLGALLAAGALFFARSPDADQLHGWHRLELADELTAERAGEVQTLEDYAALEDALWAELRRRQGGWPGAREPLSRYNPTGPLAPGLGGRDWNRTFELEPGERLPGEPARASGGVAQDGGEAPRATVLLLHGLSDSPYSLRAVGQALAARGHHVIGLRLPGHGTAPGALRDVSWHDWRAAVRLGARQAVARSGDAPLVVVGYSNGAALALDYALEALDDPLLPQPRRLVLISPALAVSPLAAAARMQGWLGRLPGLEPLGWESVVPEYDPYKYNSFPMRAAAEIHALTGDVGERLEALRRAGRGGELPPILTFQSVADATVPAAESLARIYGEDGEGSAAGAGHGDELVLFDLDRQAEVGMFLAPGAGELARRIDRPTPWPLDLTLVTNADPASGEAAGAGWWRGTGRRAPRRPRSAPSRSASPGRRGCTRCPTSPCPSRRTIRSTASSPRRGGLRRWAASRRAASAASWWCRRTC